MTNFFYAKELLGPEEVIPHLARQGHHWKKNYSAYELAHSWFAANGIPKPVRDLLSGCVDYRGAELIEAFFERDVDLRTEGRRSQTDLLAFISVGNERAVIAVEGKVDEPFGELVSEWRDGSANKEVRLKSLCNTLGLDPGAIGHLRYQLFHRSVSAIYEAQRYRCDRAMVLVHSFSPSHASFADFAAFTGAMGVAVSKAGEVSEQKSCEGVQLRFAWCADAFAA